MSAVNLLADKIEQAIGKMFAQAAEEKSGMYHYALLFNAKKSKTWFIVLFFEDKAQLKKSLDNGFCYSIHRFLKNELVLIDKALPIRIRFDAGQYPSNEMEYERLLEKNRVTHDTLANEKGQQQICSQCGHDWNKHKLMGYGNPPHEGWMICPDEDCFCFGTWDMAEKAIKAFDQLYNDETSTSGSLNTRAII